jgi:hypothetical protein
MHQRRGRDERIPLGLRIADRQRGAPLRDVGVDRQHPIGEGHRERQCNGNSARVTCVRSPCLLGFAILQRPAP